MKKLIALILAAVVLFAAAAVAEDRDPIVGYWYMLYDSGITPEFKSTLPGVRTEISAYDFRADGTIFLLDNTVADDDTSSQSYAACGKWSKSGSGYTYSIMGTGEGEIVIKDDVMYMQIAPQYYMKIRKMIVLNPYTDMTAGIN
jgi:hypothetical protein